MPRPRRGPYRRADAAGPAARAAALRVRVGAGDDRGSGAAAVLIFALVFMALAAFVVDGGLSISKRERAADIAEQAARYAAQDIDVDGAAQRPGRQPAGDQLPRTAPPGCSSSPSGPAVPERRRHSYCTATQPDRVEVTVQLTYKPILTGTSTSTTSRCTAGGASRTGPAKPILRRPHLRRSRPPSRAGRTRHCRAPDRQLTEQRQPTPTRIRTTEGRGSSHGTHDRHGTLASRGRVERPGARRAGSGRSATSYARVGAFLALAVLVVGGAGGAAVLHRVAVPAPLRLGCAAAADHLGDVHQHADRAGVARLGAVHRVRARRGEGGAVGRRDAEPGAGRRPQPAAGPAAGRRAAAGRA